MKTVAIVAEYNPFHTGHAYQIQKIREEFGADTAIIAISSGNFVQRGDVAVADKLTRAKCAVLCGANLVLELPFPYSMSSADIFARAAVSVADSLGTVDYLSFGSESGDITELSYVSEVLLSNDYAKELENIRKNQRRGYAKCCELAYKSCAEKYRDFEFSSNNILAVEYIKALRGMNSKIEPHTIKRSGAEYNDTSTDADAPHQSATAIRALMLTDFHSALPFVPEQTRDTLSQSYKEGSLPADSERISAAIISHFRLTDSSAAQDIHDAGDGLYNRLANASLKANNISSLLELTETKKYTKARTRRAMWYGFFGVTSSDVKTAPAFTQVLAMDTVGMSKLRDIGKSSRIHVLTKPSDYMHFDEAALRQKKLSERADSVFEMTRPASACGNWALTLTPFIKK